MKLNVKNLEDLLQAKGLTQSALAELCGVTRQYISTCMQNANAGRSTVERIANAIGCEACDISDMKPNRVTFIPAAFNAAMFDNGLRYKSVAMIADLAPQTVSKAAHGSPVTIRTARRIAWAVGSTVEALTEGGDVNA